MRCRLLPLLTALLAAPAVPAQTPPSDLQRELITYCGVRERTTDLLVEGRDKGIAREQVLERLPALKPESGDAEAAAHSRLDDVYAMPRIGAKTLVAHRYFGCLLQGLAAGKPPRFDKGIEDALFECQTSGGASADHLGCVRAAQRKHLVP